MRRKKRKPVGIWGRGCWQFNVLILLLLWYGLMKTWSHPHLEQWPPCLAPQSLIPHFSHHLEKEEWRILAARKKKGRFSSFLSMKAKLFKANVLCFPSPTTIEHHSLLFSSLLSKLRLKYPQQFGFKSVFIILICSNKLTGGLKFDKITKIIYQSTIGFLLTSLWSWSSSLTSYYINMRCSFSNP